MAASSNKQKGSGGHRDRRLLAHRIRCGPHMLVIDRIELERLADLAVRLYVECHRVERTLSPPSEWEPVLVGLDQFAAQFIRRNVMRGDLVAAARTLIDPDTRCCCGLRCFAQVDQYLDAEDVRELQLLWEQPAISSYELAARLGFHESGCANAT